jgi:hypothetical protein
LVFNNLFFILLLSVLTYIPPIFDLLNYLFNK